MSLLEPSPHPWWRSAMGGYCLIHGDLVTDSAIKKDKLSGKDVLLVEISVKVNCLMRSYHGKAPEGDDYASREGCAQPTHTTTAVPQVIKSWFRPSCIWKNWFSLLGSFLYKILVLFLSDTFYRKFMGNSWFPISACTANLLLSEGVFGVMSKLALLLLQWGWTVWYQKRLAQCGRTLQQSKTSLTLALPWERCGMAMPYAVQKLEHEAALEVSLRNVFTTGSMRLLQGVPVSVNSAQSGNTSGQLSFLSAMWEHRSRSPLPSIWATWCFNDVSADLHLHR